MLTQDSIHYEAIDVVRIDLCRNFPVVFHVVSPVVFELVSGSQLVSLK